MKKKFLTYLTLAASLLAGAYQSWAGDIYDIHACKDANGLYASYASSDLPLYGPTGKIGTEMVAGDRVYIKLRLLSRKEDDGTYSKESKWDFVYTGLGSELTSYVKPQLGIYVSGALRFATYEGRLTAKELIGGEYLTDLVFSYVTQPGDFALPIVLALKGNDGKPYPANDPNESTHAYYMNPLGESDWSLRYQMADKTYVTANMTVVSGQQPPTGVTERIRDWTLHRSSYRIRTIDFDSKWEESGTLWRSVHADSTITVGVAPQLVAKAAPSEAVTLYVWSTNDAVVVMGGTPVTMPDPDNVKRTKTYQVAKVTMAGGSTSADFSIKGDLNGEGKWSGLVLSAYSTFNLNDDYNDIRDDFIVVPVKCIEPLPPSVIVEANTSTAIAGYDYKKAAARLTVRLSQAISKEITVKLTPKLTDGTDISTSEKAGEYVRFSKTMDTVGSLPDATNAVEVTIGPGADATATVYVFCLRGDIHTSGINEMQFVPSAVSGPTGEITDWTPGGFNIVAQTPVITTPAEGEIFEAIQFDETPITIKVEGSYADAAPAKGYEIWVKLTPSAAKFTKLDGLYYPGDGNVLYLTNTTDVLPTLTYTSTSTAENPWKSQIYVKAPASEKTSAPDAVYRTIYAVVSPAKSSSVVAYNMQGEEDQNYDEGERVKFKIEISDTYDSDIYAFLKPSDNITDGKIFSGTTPFMTVMDNAKGLRIGRGKTSAEGTLTLLDGWDPEAGGLNFSVEVVLRDKQKWNDASAKTIKGFDCSPLDLTVNNKEPTITRIELNGVESEASEYQYPNKLASGQNQEFKAIVKDVTYDLNNGFQCKWTPYLNGSAQDPTEIIGNPSTHTYTNNFSAAGIWTIRLQVKDKDMEDWSETDYKVKVEVLTNPAATIEADEYYAETDNKGLVTVGLTYLEPGVTLHGVVEVSAFKKGVENEGLFILETNEVTFTSSSPQTIRVAEMDGTGPSSTYGFNLSVRIDGAIVNGVLDKEAINPKTGNKWSDYYLTGSTRVFVENTAPNKGDESKTFTPEANTNVWEVAGGSATTHPLKFFVRSDVDNDFSYTYSKWPEAGIKVTITGGGGDSYNEDGFVKGVKIFSEPGDGTFIPNFGSSQGDQEVTITVEDKDGGSLSRTWKFTVTPSKFLTTIATGPSGGTTSSSMSQKYAGAAGIGQGHVWANELFVSATDFRLEWNCSKNQTASLYAWGYKTNTVDNGMLNGGKDIWLDANGSAQAGVTPSSTYAYADPLKDSFLYTWIQTTTDDGGQVASAILGAIAPERSANAPAVADVILAAEQNEDNTYPKTIVEAIFSKEYLSTDNMGDINQDGIPDLYITKYYMGVIDEATGAIAEDGKDLKSLRSYNADVDKDGAEAPDYLPGYGVSALGTLIPGVKEQWSEFGVEFSAYMEIRGYGDGLNDAPAQAGITGVKPDRIYAEEIDGEWQWTEKCSISELEFASWQLYAAANGLDWTKKSDWEAWSPERPTSPVLDDTDEDGFSDGYEYYFWYRAHVGDPTVFASSKKLVRLTGRAYDPRNPGNGRLITSEEIERTFDPLTPNGSAETAKLVDTDNDGLPDYLEALIGTNPLDFDSDGDGLPDGYEILLCGTDPLLAYTTKDVSDAMRNYDGDAMAFTTPKLEENVLPTPKQIKAWTSFAVEDLNGDSDVEQWYVTRSFSGDFTADVVDGGTIIETEAGRFYAPKGAVVTASGRLAVGLTRDELRQPLAYAVQIIDPALEEAYPVLDDEEENPIADYVRLAPTVIPAGTQLVAIKQTVPDPEGEEGATKEVTSYTVTAKVATLSLSSDIPAKNMLAPSASLHAAWIYGRDVDSTTTDNQMLNLGGFGMLAVGRYQGATKGAVVTALPSKDRTVALLHYLVYEEFGFDPRTAWNAHTPLNARWGSTDGDSVLESSYNSYAGCATRTRNYTAYDEFLLLSFFLNNGKITMADVTASTTVPWYKIWSKYTTNPQGPGELWETDDENYKGRTAETTGNGINGADTDDDGVPDGWELYVMAGPKQLGFFNFAGPYNDNHFSHFGPFVGDADSKSWTDSSASSGYASVPGDGDGLTELAEYQGTDSCNYYGQPQDGSETAYSTTVVLPEGWKWFNKFFPTDPWGEDTDNDGIADAYEIADWTYTGSTVQFKCSNFLYDTEDNGSTCIPGGGLNPLSIDTDGDGLPDQWEAQFAGETLYVDEDGKSKHGFIDGMDGTVPDARSNPVVYKAGDESETDETDTNSVSTVVVNVYGDPVNRDYDHDGLENWQEYMTGMMRCWRYDDPLTTWTAFPIEMYCTTGADGKMAFDVSKAAEELFDGDVDRFWYETLVNTQGDYYNPHFLTGLNPANYMSRVENGWDKAYSDSGAYYWMLQRIGNQSIADLWCNSDNKKHLPISGSMSPVPLKYACCSPLEYDSDQDGLDDYYELFHGMNPLLGESGQIADSTVYGDEGEVKYGPCDLIYDAWYIKDVGALEAWASSATASTANYWQRDEGRAKLREAKCIARGFTPATDNAYDFETYPWLNGLQMADPDGDDIRNLYESIQPKLSGDFYLHTDPTPLWMTDATYSNSLTRLHFRMQKGAFKVPLNEVSFKYKSVIYYFRDFDGYQPPSSTASAYLAAYSPDKWGVFGPNASYNWMYSFEENEGFDSDHDFVGDYEESQGTKHTASDALDADSPRRRQAVYFPGYDETTGRGSVLQTLPEEVEQHPLGSTLYPNDMTVTMNEAFQTFTIELWVKPDSVEVSVPQTIFERAIWTGQSKLADKQYLRKNFQLAIREGKWYAKYDTAGTDSTDAKVGKVFETYSGTAANAGSWTHLAAAYNGAYLTLYVNGVAQQPVAAHLAPATTASAFVFQSETSHEGDYWYSKSYKYHAFLVGASVFGRDALDVTAGKGFGSYGEFYRGYVDEIRVWDGARSSTDIVAEFEIRKRYTREDVIENRNAVYRAWRIGASIPELRHHWSFDAIAGAENAGQVAKWPHGFAEEDGPVLSRPANYVVGWWKKTVDAYGSVYAGSGDWVTWIPDTVAHLPRFDGTTLDSAFWSDAYAGATAGTYVFPQTAEPVSRWTQMIYGSVRDASSYRSTGSRHRFVNDMVADDASSTLYQRYEFAGRNRNLSGDDLLPLGGAFVKYVDTMWDEQGAASVWEQTGSDANANGLPDWWEEYADRNYRPEGMEPGTDLGWNTVINRKGISMTAGEAYLRDLAAGMYVGSDGTWHAGPTVYAQTAKSDKYIPDWWKDLFKISDQEPFADSDNDGLNNYVEYLADEVLPFGVRLDPLMARSDTVTLDYFRKFGKLYLGEMLTDHDMMEDHWERSLGDETIASTFLWDASKDADEDGWDNFAENRYNGYAVSTLAQLISHKIGDVEARDFPVPVLKLKVRYNGNQLASGATDAGGEEGESENTTEAVTKRLVLKTYSSHESMRPDACYSILSGSVNEEKYVYIGGWENRMIRGAMSPGHVDIRTISVKFYDVNSDSTYTWKDSETGTWFRNRPYEDYYKALKRGTVEEGSLIVDTWTDLSERLPGGSSESMSVVCSRDPLLQIGYIHMNGLKVCTIDLDSGEFIFDMKMMEEAIHLADKDATASNSIFRIHYQSIVPDIQNQVATLTLAQPDSGFVRKGKNTIEVFYDLNNDGVYTPGEPYGVISDVDIGWCGRSVEIELTDMSAITPRVSLWSSTGAEGGGMSGGMAGGGEAGGSTADASSSDRGTRVGTESFTDGSNRFEVASVSAPQARVRVVRYKVDDFPVYKVGVAAGVVLDKTFDSDVRSYLAEGDFLTDGKLDIDWDHLYSDVVDWHGAKMAGCEVTNVTYLIVYNWDASSYTEDDDTNSAVKASSTLVTRRFEKRRTIPKACPERAVFNLAQPTFAWKIENEDTWASWFGTTYTGFKVLVKDEDGMLVYDSGIRRLPAKDTYGVYSWTAPLFVGEKVSGTGKTFSNLTKYTWEVALYNAKFRGDDRIEMYERGNPFSTPEVFRMNVTTADASSESLALRACYAGPATDLADKVRVQVFTTPDFTGDPVAETTLGDISLDPSETGANVTVIGLRNGSYFVRAYIDTNDNGVRDDWESWGYLSERDRADTAGIFEPATLTTSVKPILTDVRKLFIEDCDTDGDWFPDVWEAEQNGNTFDRTRIEPVSGNAELIGVNTNLVDTLDAFPSLSALGTKKGFALVSGVSEDKVMMTSSGIAVDNKVESVQIGSLGFDENGNVAVSVEAVTTSESIGELSGFYKVATSPEKKVTCKVYYRESLTADWNPSPVAERTVTVGAEAVTLEVDKSKLGGSSAFFKVEVVE